MATANGSSHSCVGTRTNYEKPGFGLFLVWLMLVGRVIAGLFIYECIGSKIGPKVPSTVTIGLASSVQIVDRIQTNPCTPKNESFCLGAM